MLDAFQTIEPHFIEVGRKKVFQFIIDAIPERERWSGIRHLKRRAKGLFTAAVAEVSQRPVCRKELVKILWSLLSVSGVKY